MFVKATPDPSRLVLHQIMGSLGVGGPILPAVAGNIEPGTPHWYIAVTCQFRRGRYSLAPQVAGRFGVPPAYVFFVGFQEGFIGQDAVGGWYLRVCFQGQNVTIQFLNTFYIQTNDISARYAPPTRVVEKVGQLTQVVVPMPAVQGRVVAPRAFQAHH